MVITKYTTDGMVDENKILSDIRSIKPIPKNDGVDHVNIYSKGSNVGNALSNFYTPHFGWTIETPHGKFDMLEGYYHYLRLVDYASASNINFNDLLANHPDIHSLRRCNHGYIAIREGRRIKKEVYGGTKYKPNGFSDESSLNFKLALATKLFSINLSDGFNLGILARNILDTGLIYTHYYNFSGAVRQVKYYEWLPLQVMHVLMYIDASEPFNLDDIKSKLINNKFIKGVLDES